MNDTVDYSETSDDTSDQTVASRKRLRGFTIHMSLFLIVMNVLVILNFIYTPQDWWFVLPLILWGTPLALHAAYVMGLFRVFRR